MSFGDVPPVPLVAPLDPDTVPALTPLLAEVERRNGYVPNSMLTMARVPDLVEAFAGLASTVLRPGRVGSELKSLVALVASTAAGCRYCQAHTSTTASKAGHEDRKVAEVWSFETSPLFDDRERAALRLARDAAQVPNLVDQGHRADLAFWFDESEITELVAVIALFGFLNRWNDTMGTPLESLPAETAQRVLGAIGWQPGKHGSGPAT